MSKQACHAFGSWLHSRAAPTLVTSPMQPIGSPAQQVIEAGPVAASVHPDAQPYAGGSGPSRSAVVSRLHRLDEVHDRLGEAPRGRRLPGPAASAAGPRHELARINQTAWTDWYACVDEAFETLRARCEQVFLAGLSMGGALCLRLAEQHGACRVWPDPSQSGDQHQRSADAGAVGLEAASLARGIVNDIAKPGQDEWGYDRLPLRALYSQTFLWADVRRNLHHVDQPLLVYRAINDHVADPSSVRLIKAGVRSSDQTYIELQRSYHVATLDYEAEDIFDGSIAFFRRLTKEADGTAE